MYMSFTIGLESCGEIEVHDREGGKKEIII